MLNFREHESDTSSYLSHLKHSRKSAIAMAKPQTNAEVTTVECLSADDGALFSMPILLLPGFRYRPASTPGRWSMGCVQAEPCRIALS
ncbi:hypothetical protein HBH56_158730 [Parastagonospora nodorum]|uniref:Uncharacterized protein n=1 Tax=Phaeosphaeria nodorum (strain SN15 / ATCC MYA-4574 / FGSC 10173) TaxID=321614 RepID=A0A7U2I2U6_PHANO|nr:hypothetical protein HBH56_158730 [Parastagonospora nodorum]QRC97362.1 hypothetical protein JI435_088590 [Parastagonospora nodorum SN15]KAH3922500.1 hypothetical protein HBH54_223160 [Parastagonospora nodorum]KAH3946980.1 hypothetical protein HBH53_123180 [Parastagonospora nodorum]KAH3973572.1 hypothetical protein HBH51_096370 [Parastagonospora nodorum]